jgi:hypothetical protein
MRRREFIALLGGAAAGWPIVVHAQQSAQMRRIGVLMNRAADNPQGQIHLAAFQKSLQELGLSDGGNVRIDLRWGANIVDLERKYAAELVALAPDVILASGTQTSTLPIVFVGVSDPVGAGFVDNLARPGGNTTVSLPKSRFVRIDGGARQGSDTQQCLRTSRSGVCRACPSQARREFAPHYNRSHISQEFAEGARR